ncbi:MAG: hypothetical protein IKD39_05605, partial [Oscillospiraceae bacterium]|nr:hypothetical protein [Oscillospiraceae bacterium]
YDENEPGSCGFRRTESLILKQRKQPLSKKRLFFLFSKYFLRTDDIHLCGGVKTSSENEVFTTDITISL